MTDRKIRAIGLGLLASTALASPTFAQTADPADTPSRQAARSEESEGEEIIVTATKREENLQDVPVSIQAIGTRRLDQLNISNFEEYTKQLPSVSYQTSAPGSTVVYMRGVASGGDGNHSGSLPSVGSYLDEQPVTTIGGTLDVHVYDIARIESLAGPQGTLFGASSQAGTIRIITNKPELGVTSGRVDFEANKIAKGGFGGSAEGMINLPLGDIAALRVVGFYQRDAGYIDNVLRQTTYLYNLPSEPGDPPASQLRFNNNDVVDDDINTVEKYGGRAALRVDLNENWTVTPTVLYQNMDTRGTFSVYEDQDDLETVRFRDEYGTDEFVQAALTVEGKIANFDLTYSGAYLNRDTFGESDYADYTDGYDIYYTANGSSLLDAQNYTDNNGNIIDPRQYVTGGYNYKKLSQEIRLSSPTDKALRVLVGAFYQRQTADILQEYRVDNLATSLSVDGRPGLIWLTKQERVDRDYALFGEATFDITPKITLIGGGRFFKYNNTLFGFAGFGLGNPGGFSSGVNRCQTINGLELRRDRGSPLAQGGIDGTPCTNVGNVVDGKLVPRRSKGDGFIHRVSAQYKPNEDLMFYGTWSRGFRPGGINRNPAAPAYDPDFLTNFELGWKTTLAGGAIRWNGAVYHQKWDSFQFSFLGPNGLTIITNGRDAEVNGIETDFNYTGGGLTLNAAAAYTDAKTVQNICGSILSDANCTDDVVITPKGTRLPVTPKFKAAASARYAWPMGTGRMHAQAGVSYQSSASTDIRQIDDFGILNPNDIYGRLGAYALVDVAAGFNGGKYNVEAFISNLFDERNELSRFSSCAAAICQRARVVIGRPRTIGVRFGTRF